MRNYKFSLRWNYLKSSSSFLIKWNEQKIVCLWDFNLKFARRWSHSNFTKDIHFVFPLLPPSIRFHFCFSSTALFSRCQMNLYACYFLVLVIKNDTYLSLLIFLIFSNARTPSFFGVILFPPFWILFLS